MISDRKVPKRPFPRIATSCSADRRHCWLMSSGISLCGTGCPKTKSAAAGSPSILASAAHMCPLSQNSVLQGQAEKDLPAGLTLPFTVNAPPRITSCACVAPLNVSASLQAAQAAAAHKVPTMFLASCGSSWKASARLVSGPRASTCTWPGCCLQVSTMNWAAESSAFSPCTVPGCEHAV